MPKYISSQSSEGLEFCYCNPYKPTWGKVNMGFVQILTRTTSSSSIELKAPQIEKRKYFGHSCSCNVYLIATVIVLLSLILPFSHCHVGSFLSAGEGKPPLVSHARVSRGPGDGYGYGSIYSSSNGVDMDSGIMNSGRPYVMKSPSYQHKMNHISQFHSNPNSNSHFGLLPTYPVASIYMKGNQKYGNTDDIYSADSGNGENIYTLDKMMDDNGDRNEQATIIPFLSARALSNMPKFFEHLRENLNAMRESEPTLEDSSSLESSEDQQFDLPSRRGDYFQSDGRLSINTDDEGYGYAYEKKGEPVTEPENDKLHPLDKTGEGASVDLLDLMGRDPKYKKANKYNPSWLFTNLGLGK